MLWGHFALLEEITRLVQLSVWFPTSLDVAFFYCLFCCDLCSRPFSAAMGRRQGKGSRRLERRLRHSRAWLRLAGFPTMKNSASIAAWTVASYAKWNETSLSQTVMIYSVQVTAGRQDVLCLHKPSFLLGSVWEVILSSSWPCLEGLELVLKVLSLSWTCFELVLNMSWAWAYVEVIFSSSWACLELVLNLSWACLEPWALFCSIDLGNGFAMLNKLDHKWVPAKFPDFCTNRQFPLTSISLGL